jgi:hypothetical protein
MNTRALFSFIILLIAVVASPAAEDTNQSAISNGQQHGFHSKIPWGVGSGMEGTVTNIVVTDQIIRFQLTGWFWLIQYPEGGTNKQVIKVDCKRGISATVKQPDSFVRMTRNWDAGSVKNGKGYLQKILQTAAERGTVVKFELTQPKIDFGGEHGFTLIDANVWRITDADLR